MHNQNAFAKAMAENPHLRRYVDSFYAKTKRMPEFCVQLSRDMKEIEFPNIIYPVGDPVFVHIYKKEREDEAKYIVIEPGVSRASVEKYNAFFERMVEVAPDEEEPLNPQENKTMLEKLLRDICVVGEKKEGLLSKLIKTSSTEKIYLTPEEFKEIRYKMLKDLVGLGVLEPFIKDTYIEDVHCVGVGKLFVVHKIFELMESNVRIETDAELDEYCYKLSEIIDKPVSKTVPIVDGALPDGSRINIIYSREISTKGSSFTIRKFTPKPLSITQIVEWGTLSPEMAAYLWICIENGMSIFICGETASGKTTTLNALCAFIKPDSKVLTAEDTPEVKVPHECWQRLITRSAERAGGVGIEMHDLLKAALRSRPHYIIVGEIRGKEGNVAFQAMQTGHPCMSTFHASTVRKMIQRFEGDPIYIPVTVIDNLNVVLIQQAVYIKGNLLRRMLELTEIEGYSKEAGGILTRSMFDWIPRTDTHLFKGIHNSYILEEKIARTLGLADKRDIYNELKIRARIIQEMVNRQIFDYTEVFEVTKKYWYHGLEGLPFEV